MTIPDMPDYAFGKVVLALLVAYAIFAIWNNPQLIGLLACLAILAFLLFGL